jgi:hypothetical protein
MTWPLSQDYNEAIQDPASAFCDAELRTGELRLNALGLPLPCSGNFADVYRVSCPGSTWAVKCFTREVPGLQQRYSAVSRHLQEAALPFTVDFVFLEQGIRIRSQWFPVLKMRWVEGFLFNEFVRDNLDKPALLQALQQIWVRLAKRLREANLAHCDLQHGNVLLVPGSKAAALAVKLIDYDGMWVPALAQSKSGEVGHPNYQHPQRLREGTYNREVDRFPFLVTATALRALVVGGRKLWERHDNGDNLLFRENDLKAPQASALFDELEGFSDPGVKNLVGRLRHACQAPLGETPFLEELIPEEKPSAVQLTRTPVTTPTAAAATSAWDFASATAEDNAGRGQGRPTQRRQRSGSAGVPLWVWAASAGVAAVVVLVVALVLLLYRTPATSIPQVAFHNPSPSTHPALFATRQPGGGPPSTAAVAPTDLRPPDTRRNPLDPDNPSSQEEPLIKNGGFEAGIDDWDVVTYGAKPVVEPDTDVVHGGKQSLRISSTAPTDTAPGQEILLHPSTRYQFTGWVRTRGLNPLGAGAFGTYQIQRENGGGLIASGPNHQGNTEWTEVRIPFQSPPDGRVRVAIFFVGFGKGTGTAWFDDLKLEQVGR